jgi:N utilization substance protein B
MAGPRRRSREIALQILHQMDVSPDVGVEAALALYFGHFSGAPADGQRDDDDDADDDQDPASAHERSAARFDRSLVDALVKGVSQYREELDGLLAQVSHNWRVERMAVVDRNVIRLALFELKHCPEVPVNVAINEAIELAKRYGTVEASAFVNGLLDRAVTELDIQR